MELDNGSAFLIATAEKALADKIRAVRGTGIKTLGQMRDYLADDLRIYEPALKALNPSHVEEIARRYRSRKIRILKDIIYRARTRDGRDDYE